MLFPYLICFAIAKSREDIDVEWIKKQEHIDYQYNNEFSIRRLFDDIKNTV